MDIEGSEFDVLENFPKHHASKIKGIYCEFHPYNEQDANRKEAIIQKLKLMGISVHEWS